MENMEMEIIEEIEEVETIDASEIIEEMQSVSSGDSTETMGNEVQTSSPVSSIDTSGIEDILTEINANLLVSNEHTASISISAIPFDVRDLQNLSVTEFCLILITLILLARFIFSTIGGIFKCMR